ncbi:amidohydrolase family protein [Chloroflexota bacterium]
MGNKANDYLIIDCHTHFFPPEIFLKVVQGMGDNPVENYSGTIEDLLSFMEKDGVSKAIILTFLPTAQMKDRALRQLPSGLPDYKKAEAEIDEAIVERIERHNQWACSLSKEHANLVPFISIDPLMGAKQMRQEILDKVKNHGARGLKLNPGQCRFFSYDIRLWPAYEAAQEIDLPVMAQSYICAGPTQFSEPKFYGDVLSQLPKLRLILTHSGMPFWEQVSALATAYTNVCFDISLVLAPKHKDSLSDVEFISLYREVGMDRIVYGSSFPWHPRAPVIERILNMDLTEEEKRGILGENALRIFKLS